MQDPALGFRSAALFTCVKTSVFNASGNAGESGKSTVVKQMKIIHQNGYTEDELTLFRTTVYKNVMDSASSLVMAMRKFKLDPVEPVNRAYADRIMDFRSEIVDPANALSSELVHAIESLWHDPIIPTVLDRTSEFYLMDSAAYFFDEIQRIGRPDYLPNETDVLRARTKTTGISETKFKSGQLSIHMFDVGGQRSERKKVRLLFHQVSLLRAFLDLSSFYHPVDPLLRSCDEHYFLCCTQRVRPSFIGRIWAKQDGGEFGFIRERH